VIDSFTGATERHIEVGDGLEIYIVLAASASPDLSAGLEGKANVKGVPGEFTVVGGGEAEGERMFIMRRELKKD
jgi:20S proteasome subunit beta 6